MNALLALSLFWSGAWTAPLTAILLDATVKGTAILLAATGAVEAVMFWLFSSGLSRIASSISAILSQR